MRKHRFFIKEKISAELSEVEDAELSAQLKNVFRARSGEEISLFDGTGKEAAAEIAEIKKEGVSIRVKEIFKNEREPENNVTLFCSILKKENFELVVQKATEVGVNKIVPLLSGRTIKQNINTDRLKKIVKEAAEQCGRGIIPEIASPIDLKEAVELSVKGKTENIFFDGSGVILQRGDLCKKEGGKILNIFIGPEGGWTEEEIALAKENGLKILSLGKTTLRGETAAIVASYLATNF